MGLALARMHPHPPISPLHPLSHLTPPTRLKSRRPVSPTARPESAECRSSGTPSPGGPNYSGSMLPQPDNANDWVSALFREVFTAPVPGFRRTTSRRRTPSSPASAFTACGCAWTGTELPQDWVARHFLVRPRAGRSLSTNSPEYFPRFLTYVPAPIPPDR